TGVQTCALPIWPHRLREGRRRPLFRPVGRTEVRRGIAPAGAGRRGLPPDLPDAEGRAPDLELDRSHRPDQDWAAVLLAAREPSRRPGGSGLFGQRRWPLVPRRKDPRLTPAGT